MMREFDGTAWLIGLVLLLFLLALLRKHGVWFLLFFSIFWVYLLVLVGVTLFPMPLMADVQRVGVWVQIATGWRFSGLNLVPLYFGNCWELPRLCAIGIWENILMTVPWGFGINFLVRLRPRDFLWLALVPGVVIELSQLLMGVWLGMSYRTVDVNDVLFNTLGVWLGVAAFSIFARLTLALARCITIKQSGVLAYMLSVME